MTILITGASSGIGASLARAYASPGVRLVLGGRDRVRLEDVAGACRDSGAVAEAMLCDLTDVMAMAQRMEMVDCESPIDLVFLNAGLGGSLPPGDTAQDPDAAYRMAMVNFTAPVVAANLMADRMAARGTGRIVLIGSVAQAFPLPMAPAYAGTKAGLAMFARGLRLRLEGTGVGITLVVPGFVDTPMSRALAEPRPFLLTPDRAAAIIREGVAGGRREIVLPWPFAVIMMLAQWLPRAAIDALLRLLWRRFARLTAATAKSWAQASRPVFGVLRWAVPIGVTGYLLYSLSRLGWGQVWAARPGGAAFYAVLLLPFFVQPLTDLAIYRRLLAVGRQLPLAVLLRKRFLNNTMLEYSGEGYFILWACDHLPVPHRRLLHAVKDSNILSGGAGLVTVGLVLLALLWTGGATLLPALLTNNARKLGTAAALPLVLCIALVTLGSRVTSLTRRQMAATFLLHLARSLIALSLEFLLWRLSGALPSTALCLQFVGLHLVVTRLPLVPRKDLLFVGLGMAAAGATDANAPAVAAVLILLTATEQVLELAIVGFPWLMETRFGRTARLR